jgi:hypothetical protein
MRATATIGLLLAIATPCFAQAPTEPESAVTKSNEALALFKQGMQALERGAYAQARQLFETSLRLQAHPSTAFNLAVTARRMSDPAFAVTTLRLLIRGEFGPIGAAEQSEAEDLAKEVAKEASLLELQTNESGGELRFDGLVIDSPAQGLAFSKTVNPGRHVLEWRVSGFEPWVATVQTKRGETVRLSPKLTPQVSAPRASPMLTQAAKAPAEQDRAWFHNPWVWVVAGGIVAAGTAAFFVDRPTADGKSDPVFGVTQTLLIR